MGFEISIVLLSLHLQMYLNISMIILFSLFPLLFIVVLLVYPFFFRLIKNKDGKEKTQLKLGMKL